VARLLRGLLPVLAAAATAAATGLPAAAAVTSPAAVSPAVVTRSSEWWLNALHVPAAQRSAHAAGGAAGHGVTVAVLSTGVDASHPDLTGQVITGPDLNQTGRTRGGSYWGAEGTAVASLIAGHGHGPGGDQGITGVAPGARILSVPVTLEYNDPLNVDAAATGRLPAAIAAGIRYAVNHGATVIALPLDPGALGAAPPGDPAADGSAAEQSAVRYARAHDVVLVAPAGDDGAAGNAVNYPAAYPGVITVGATSRAGQLAPFTSRHSYVALTAPGSGDTPETAEISTSANSPAGLTVADPDGGYQSLASSDMSAALTAGVAALIRSRYPRLTAAEVGQALERGAVTVGTAAPGWGRGKLDAARAVTAAAAIAATQPAPSASAAPSASPSPATPAASASASPAGLQPAPPAAQGQSASGRLLRALAVGLTVAAAVLIIALFVLVLLARAHRRRARASAAPRGGGQRGRHARDPHAGPPPSPRPASGAPFPPAPPPAVTAVPLVPDFPVPRAVRWPDDQPQRLAPDERPPWPPAREPGQRVSPDAFLPAEAGLPPAPAFPLPPGFPPASDFRRAPWSVSTSGPMYVWNPNAATGPQDELRSEPDEPAETSEDPPAS
jgi:subtilisin family serine protease